MGRQSHHAFPPVPCRAHRRLLPLSGTSSRPGHCPLASHLLIGVGLPRRRRPPALRWFGRSRSRLEAIDVHKDFILGKAVMEVVVQAFRRVRGVLTPVTDEDLAIHFREPPSATRL